MKTGFNNSSTFITYSFLSVAFGITLATTVLWVGLILFELMTGKGTFAGYVFSVKLNPVMLDSSANSFSSGYYLGNISGELKILYPVKLILFLSKLIPLIVRGTICCSVYLLRKIIKNVDDGKQFVNENVKYVRIIGWLIIIIPHIKTVFENMAINSIPSKTMVNGMIIGKSLSSSIQIFNFAVIPEYILIGLLVLVLAEVFKAGKTIKDENDLTV